MEFIAIIGSSIKNLNFIYLFPLLVFIFIHFVAEPSRWSIYLNKTNNPLFNTIGHIFFLTAFLSYLLPIKLGLPIRIGLLKRSLNLEIKFISKFLLLDGALYYGAWTSMACVAGVNLLSNFQNVINYPIITSILLLLSILLVLFIFYLKIKKYSIKSSNSIKTWILQIHSIYRSINKVKVISLLLITYADIASHVLRHWALLGMVGYMLPIDQVFVITTISIFTGLISMLPMGFGGYDITVVLLLTQASVPLETAILVPLLNRIGTILISTLLGLQSSYFLGISLFDLDQFKNSRKI